MDLLILLIRLDTVEIVGLLFSYLAEDFGLEFF
jgi:hypothetical protein